MYTCLHVSRIFYYDCVHVSVCVYKHTHTHTHTHTLCIIHLCINIIYALLYPGRKGPRDCADVARSSADLAEVRGLTRISAIIIAYVNPQYAELR